MAQSLQIPIWTERERPTTYLIDQHTPGHDSSTLPETDGDINSDYLEWINSLKGPLHDSLRSVHTMTVDRLDQRGIDLQAICKLVAHTTGRPAYPIERVVTSHDVRSNPVYIAASDGGFFPKDMSFGEDGIAYGQFEHVMHFVRLRQSYITRAAKADVVDTVAHELGHATLAPVTYVHLDRLESGNEVYHWFGYSWRCNDRYYGELLDEASAAKVAAVVRRELGLPGSYDPTASLAEPYRESRGFSYASIGAVALDVLNHAAGHTDGLAIYRPLWAFMANVQDESAREELANIIRRATDNQLSLEALEAAELSTKGLPLDTLAQIEEVCGIEASKRPSHLIREVGIQ